MIYRYFDIVPRYLDRTAVTDQSVFSRILNLAVVSIES